MKRAGDLDEMLLEKVLPVFGDETVETERLTLLGGSAPRVRG